MYYCLLFNFVQVFSFFFSSLCSSPFSVIVFFRMIRVCVVCSTREKSLCRVFDPRKEFVSCVRPEKRIGAVCSTREKSLVVCSTREKSLCRVFDPRKEFVSCVRPEKEFGRVFDPRKEFVPCV